jgi:hypothetical protein
VNCGDNNVCTNDRCDPDKGCYHVAAAPGTTCNDNNVCTEKDECQGTQCVGGGAPPEVCGGGDEDCDGQTDEEGALGCKTYYYDADQDGWGVDTNSRCYCEATGKYSTTVAGDCNGPDAYVHPGALELCNGKDDDCDGTIDNLCVTTSCNALHKAHPELPTGIYPIDPDGAGGAAAFDVICDMSTDGGGFTLIGVVANDGTRKWDSLAAFTGDSTFGNMLNLTNNFRSNAFKGVTGTDLYVQTDEYEFGWRALLGGKSFADYIAAGWPASCATTWIRGKPDFSSNLTADQADLIGFTLRGWDNNASCFPDTGENTAVSMLAPECCWTNGFGNNPSAINSWGNHDLSLLKKAHLVGVSCTKGAWPCNPQGKAINFYSGGNHECYDASCKSVWARVYVR